MAAPPTADPAATTPTRPAWTSIPRQARLVAALGLAVVALLGAAVALAGGPSALARAAGVAGARQPTPNVLLIVADDMRADGLLAMPNVRRLAERGVTFTNGLATTPVCCPSRASILTGQYAHRHRVLTNDAPLGGVARFDDRSTLATWLQTAGVRTGIVGRYLNQYASLDVAPGWDRWFVLWQGTEEVGNYVDYLVTDDGARRHYGRGKEAYSTRVFAEVALEFLAREPERPFFLQLTPRAPHGPATPDPEDSGTYKTVELPLPASYDEEDISDKPTWVRENGRLSERERERLEVFRRRQLETLVGLDRAIGRLVDALRADGRLDATWIVFTSDNGLVLGEHRLNEGKACAYEPCVAVPFVVVPPGGLAEGRADARLVANIDLAPTIARLMGAEPTIPVDGLDFSPLVADAAGAVAWRDAVALEQWRDDPDKRWVAVRTERHKLVRYANGDEELYDLATDPDELENRAKNPVYAAERARLAARLRDLIPADLLAEWGIAAE
jgi:N-acetylglucosamine-6-sulfatase